MVTPLQVFVQVHSKELNWMNLFYRYIIRRGLSVCLLARLLKNACMDLDEMLRVDRCRDMDELINFWARSGF